MRHVCTPTRTSKSANPSCERCATSSTHCYSRSPAGGGLRRRARQFHLLAVPEEASTRTRTCIVGIPRQVRLVRRRRVRRLFERRRRRRRLPCLAAERTAQEVVLEEEALVQVLRHEGVAEVTGRAPEGGAVCRVGREQVASGEGEMRGTHLVRGGGSAGAS